MFVEALPATPVLAMDVVHSVFDPLRMTAAIDINSVKPPTHIKIAPGIIIASLSLLAVDVDPIMRSGKPGSIKNIQNKAANPILPCPAFSAVSSSG